METTLTNLFKYKEHLVLNPTTIPDHTTNEIYIDIEVVKAQIPISKTKKAERLMLRAGVKWHEEGEKNNAYNCYLIHFFHAYIKKFNQCYWKPVMII